MTDFIEPLKAKERTQKKSTGNPLKPAISLKMEYLVYREAQVKTPISK